MENLTVLPYLRIYFRVLNAIEKSCFETLHATSGEFCCFLMFAILEEPLPWGISQPKADFRRSGEVRRIFACQPNDVGSDRKVGGESLRRSEYFIILK